MRTRFAPSPTGYLHLGHAFSFLTAAGFAQAEGGECLLRIEDIDQLRCKPEFEQAIYEDLAWLGMTKLGDVIRQSERMDAYQEALDDLTARGLTYPCSCNRSDIKQALSSSQEGDVIGPDGLRYPGTCRDKGADLSKPTAIRLNLEKALTELRDPVGYVETSGEVPDIIYKTHSELIDVIGDFVIARKDIGTSYHLAVVVDDAYQGIEMVIRGEDIAPQTHIHVILQELLGLPTPAYYHHRLIRDENGKRLAKRDDARAIRKYREDGMTREDVLALLGL